jgi:dolichyl-diphosphooligosaccharide--protein glycosyltransferase
MVTARDVSDLLEERPDLEPAVKTVLAADEPFGFDEPDIDFGRFGEVVATDLVQKEDDGYRVADRQAVNEGLAGGVDDTTEDHWSDHRSLTKDSQPLASRRKQDRVLDAQLPT